MPECSIVQVENGRWKIADSTGRIITPLFDMSRDQAIEMCDKMNELLDILEPHRLTFREQSDDL